MKHLFVLHCPRQYVFIGDTGEFDQEAGEAMLRKYPELVKAVFLHVVSDKPFPPIPPSKLINGKPVIFFRTYVGASIKAHSLGLLDLDGLQRVIKTSKQALAAVPITSDKWTELNQDLEIANNILIEEKF